MKIQFYVETIKCRSRVEWEEEVDDEEWDELTWEEKNNMAQEILLDTKSNYMDSGWEY